MASTNSISFPPAVIGPFGVFFSAGPRVFRIELDELIVTIHPGDDPDTVRALQPHPPKYFINDVEVDQGTFDRELEQER